MLGAFNYCRMNLSSTHIVEMDSWLFLALINECRIMIAKEWEVVSHIMPLGCVTELLIKVANVVCTC